MTDPVPTKFEEGEWYAIQLLSHKSGITSKSEIIRLCVRLLAQEVKKRPEWNWVEDTARPLPTEEYAATLAA